jgi:hypothetical protein
VASGFKAVADLFKAEAKRRKGASGPRGFKGVRRALILRNKPPSVSKAGAFSEVKDEFVKAGGSRKGSLLGQASR